MASGTLVPTRDQLKRWCTDSEGTDEDLLRKIEQVFFGVEDLPALQDGIDDNTLSIATLSDLVRPITIDLIQPLSGTVSANTTYNLTVAQSTEGMKTIFIPSAFLIASAGGPFTLTITTSLGTPITVPILANGDTISSGDLMFDIHIDSAGNIVSKAWTIRGSNGGGIYEYLADGTLNQWLYDIQVYALNAAYGPLFAANVGTIWVFPVPFFALDYEVNIDAARAGTSVWCTMQALTLTTQIGFTLLDVANRGVVAFEIHRRGTGRWRA